MRYIVILLSLLMLSFPGYSAKEILLTEKNSARLLGSVSIDSVANVVRKMSEIATIPIEGPYTVERDLYLVLISPGGSIFAGLQLIDQLAALHGVKVHTITIYSASMSFITSQYLGTRYVTPHGEMMSHRARGGMQGQFPDGELLTRFKFWSKRVEDIEKHVVSRTEGKQTLESYKALRKDEYYCEGQKCIDDGFADEIAKVRCSKDLLKEKVEVKTQRFFGMKIVRKLKTNKCPIIMGTQTMSVKVNGKEYHYDNPQLNQFIEELERPKFMRR